MAAIQFRAFILTVCSTIFFTPSSGIKHSIAEVNYAIQTAWVNNNTYPYALNKWEKQVIKGYPKTGRPKGDEKPAMVHVFRFQPTHFVMDERSHSIDITAHIGLTWSDEYLEKNFKADAGVKELALPTYKIWTPDLVLLNSADGKTDTLYSYRDMVRVRKGISKVSLQSHRTISVACNFDYSDFPNDVQRCPVIIASNNYAADEIVIEGPDSEEINALEKWTPDDRIKQINGWKIASDPRKMHKMYVMDNGSITDNKRDLGTTNREVLYLWLTLARHSPGFKRLFVPPAIFTSLAIASVFMLQTRRSQIVTLLLLFIFQGLMMQSLIKKLPPSAGKLPKIASYYGLNLVLTLMQMITVFTGMTLSQLASSVPASLDRVADLADRLSLVLYVQGYFGTPVDQGKGEKKEAVKTTTDTHEGEQTKEDKEKVNEDPSEEQKADETEEPGHEQARSDTLVDIVPEPEPQALQPEQQLETISTEIVTEDLEKDEKMDKKGEAKPEKLEVVDPNFVYTGWKNTAYNLEYLISVLVLIVSLLAMVILLP